MGQSTPMLDLRQLIVLMTTIVDTFEDIDARVTTPKQFDDLDRQIAELEHLAPQDMRIKVLRALWFKHGLQSFNTQFCRPVREGNPAWTTWMTSVEDVEDVPVPGLLMTTDMIFHWLRRCNFPNGDFVVFYTEVEGRFEQMRDAADQQGHHDQARKWDERWRELGRRRLYGELENPPQ